MTLAYLSGNKEHALVFYDSPILCRFVTQAEVPSSQLSLTAPMVPYVLCHDSTYVTNDIILSMGCDQLHSRGRWRVVEKSRARMLPLQFG